MPATDPQSAPPAPPAGALPDHAEVVVVGAGHNSLVAAAYLARAGLQVLVLEAGETVGGNTRTEELTLPGFAHDSCSSAHVLIQNNPLIRDDELGLVGEQGLRYLTTDPAVVLPQPDGDVLVMRPDLGATVAELARWSEPDARAFEGMVRTWRGGLAAAHGRWSSGLAQPDDDATRAYLALRSRSAWDVVHETYEHPVVRGFVLWLAMATIQDPRRPGTGFLPSSLAAGRLDFGWTTPVGGSQALPDALVRVIEGHGGRVVCSAPVTGLATRGDRVAAVHVGEGQQVGVDRAVVAGGHLAQVADWITDRDPTEDLVTARDAWRPGLSVLAVHAALRGDLRFGDSGISAAATGLGTADGMARHHDGCRSGHPDADDPWLLVVNQTVVNPGRVPGGGATFKILTMAPWDRADGRDWADTKDEYGAALVELVRRRCTGLGDDDVLAIRTESPVDVAAHNPQNLGGSCHGGEFLLDGEVVAGWPRYDTGLDGLFLTGSTTHPGGSVSGRPGRNAARAVLTGLGLDPRTVMGPG